MANFRQYTDDDASFMDKDFLANLLDYQVDQIKVLLIEADFKWLYINEDMDGDGDGGVETQIHFGDDNENREMILKKNGESLVMASWIEEEHEVHFRTIVSIEIPRDILGSFIFVRYAL